MYKIEDIKGVIPALITVFDENQNIDVEGTKQVVNHLIDKGIDGLYVVGSTGEGFTMDKEERKEYIKLVVDIVDKRVPVITHVGMIGTKNSIELAQYSEEVGADAVSSVPPFYWKFNEDQIFNYYKDISESTKLPMIVYNVPMAGLMGSEFIARLATIENVKGVKFTALSHHDIVNIKDDCGEDFVVYSGADEMAVSGLMNGADGIIGSFYNLIPEIFIGINDAINNGEYKEAVRLQKDGIRIIRLGLQYDYYAFIKMALNWMGVNAGLTRKPFTVYDEKTENEIKNRFKDLKEKYNLDYVDFMKHL